MQFQGKRFTGILFFVLALAEALNKRLHAAADRLAAETKQRKAVQLEIGRHPVRIGRTNRITLHDTDLPFRIRMVKNGRDEAQKQSHGRGDE